MLEAVGHVIASDSEVPELSDDFTDRVMRTARRTPRVLRFPLRRVAIVAAAVAQATAVLAIAIYWNSAQPPAAPARAVPASDWNIPPASPDGEPGFVAIHRMIVEGIEDQIWDMHSAGTRLTADVVGLARYLDIALPEDVARESSKMAVVNPLQFLLDFEPTQSEPPVEVAPADGVHSL
jgi:hypothetical protein